MIITFVSNYFNHHQKEFCDTMAKLNENKFTFIMTEAMSEERRQLGYGNWTLPKYVLDMSKGDDLIEGKKRINNSDVLIIGTAPYELVKEYLRSGRIAFKYSERLFKKRMNPLGYIYRFFKLRSQNLSKKNVYLLCAGAYVAQDYYRFGLFRKRCYKWGYFPEKKVYNIEQLLQQKEKNTILWCGRFIDWKHPEYAVYLANYLKEKDYSFQMSIIGAGPLEENIRNLVSEHHLEEYVKILGSMSPSLVRSNMERTSIFISTSNRKEGWGAVLNEAMNSGCAVVASESIGSAPYLIMDERNGLLYRNDEIMDLCKKVEYLILNEKKQREFGENAYETINNEWNGEIAANRLSLIIQNIVGEESSFVGWSNGPGSLV